MDWKLPPGRRGRRGLTLAELDDQGRVWRTARGDDASEERLAPRLEGRLGGPRRRCREGEVVGRRWALPLLPPHRDGDEGAVEPEWIRDYIEL